MCSCPSFSSKYDNRGASLLPSCCQKKHQSMPFAFHLDDKASVWKVLGQDNTKVSFSQPSRTVTFLGKRSAAMRLLEGGNAGRQSDRPPRRQSPSVVDTRRHHRPVVTTSASSCRSCNPSPSPHSSLECGIDETSREGIVIPEARWEAKRSHDVCSGNTPLPSPLLHP